MQRLLRRASVAAACGPCRMRTGGIAIHNGTQCGSFNLMQQMMAPAGARCLPPSQPPPSEKLKPGKFQKIDLGWFLKLDAVEENTLGAVYP